MKQEKHTLSILIFVAFVIRVLVLWVDRPEFVGWLIVNLGYPGNATFVLLPETNHSFIKVGSMEEGVEARQNGSIRNLMMSQFNYEILTIIDEWIHKMSD